MVSKIQYTVIAVVDTIHHIIRMTTLSPDQGDILRHFQRVNVGCISVTVLYDNLIRAHFMCCFACRNDLFGHLLCKSLVYAFLLMCFIGQCHSGTALDICTDKKFHFCCFLLSLS